MIMIICLIKRIQMQIYLRREWNQLKSYNPKDTYFLEYLKKIFLNTFKGIEELQE